MNKIDLLDNDFPFTAKTVRFIQESASAALRNLAKLHGDNYILWGCDILNGYRTNGAVVVNGEIVPFEQSVVADKFEIFETAENVVYKGGSMLPAYYTRVAKCSEAGTYEFVNFKKVATRKKLEETEWISVNSWLNGFESMSTNIAYGLKYKINASGKLMIYGSIHSDGTTVYSDKTEVAQLPFAPTERVWFSLTPFSQAITVTAIPSARGFLDVDGKLCLFGQAHNEFVQREGFINCELEL